ncbi:Flavin reductase like domain containing protein [Naviculisporaceae sp. PSN 640]
MHIPLGARKSVFSTALYLRIRIQWRLVTKRAEACSCVRGAEMRLPLEPGRSIFSGIQTYHSRGIHTSSRHSQIVKLSPSPEVTSPSTNTTMTADTVEDDLAIPLSQQFRDLMRLLTQSVVVCTSTHLPHPSTPSQDPTHRAMTMSSFTSLSLRPTPAISFNIATPSRTLDAIKSSRHFNIHVLSADSSGAKVADWCRQGNEGALQLFQRLREDCQCEVTTDGPAMLQGPGVLHVLRCRLLDEEHHGGLVKVRDHFIVVGEVLEIVDGRGQGDVEDVERRFGLSYADTQYREHGRSIPL